MRRFIPLSIIVVLGAGLVLTLFGLRAQPSDTTTNSSPVAFTGPEQYTVTPRGELVLSGLGSHDPDGGEIVLYEWQIVDAPESHKTEIGTILASGKEPDVPRRQITVDDLGEWSYSLTVTDDEGDISVTTVTVLVRGEIQALENPEHASVNEVFLKDEELVAGVRIDDVAVAYPRKVMDNYAIANDIVAGEPLLLVLCEYCQSGAAYIRANAGNLFTFVGFGGTLQEDDYKAADRETDSVWDVVSGKAISGPLTGLQLSAVQVTMTTWGEWRSANPGTVILVDPSRPG